MKSQKFYPGPPSGRPGGKGAEARSIPATGDERARSSESTSINPGPPFATPAPSRRAKAAPGAPWVVVSPHLDDGVLSCGELLASHSGSLVVTVFAGTPEAGHPLTEWDRACGFAAGDDVMARRRDEDRAALSLLGAEPRWLDFLDGQYRADPTSDSIEEIASKLEAIIEERHGSPIAIPLGLFHSDHLIVHEASMRVFRRHPRRSWHAYEDSLYRSVPDVMDARREGLRRVGLRFQRVQPRSNPARAEAKRRAVDCYASQLQGLGAAGLLDRGDTVAPEGLWRIARRF